MSVKSELEERAQKYAKFNNIEVDLTKPLGFGQDDVKPGNLLLRRNDTVGGD